ncbi:MAG: hypothetical protein D3910_28945, partial [Candidatus Electrothrix sp. ATG2]|nr:hypothetical protein [Candidatus Electrothrix sp. ATG2]
EDFVKDFEPSDKVDLSFTFNNKWNWIEPWSLVGFVQRTKLFGPGAVKNALSALKVDDYLTAISIIQDMLEVVNAATGVIYRYEGILNTDIEHFGISVLIPDYKYLAWFTSKVNGYMSARLLSAGFITLEAPPVAAINFTSAALFTLSSEIFYAIAADPQPDYSQLAIAEPIPMPEECMQTGTEDVAELFSQLLGFQKALADSYIRFDAAEDAEDINAVALHSAAIEVYTAKTAQIWGEISTLLNDLIASIPTPTNTQIEEIRQTLLLEGLPEIQQCILKHFNYTDQEINELGTAMAEMPDDVYQSLFDAPDLLENWSYTLTAIRDTLEIPNNITTVKIDIK